LVGNKNYFLQPPLFFCFSVIFAALAQMAKLVDALCSGRSVRKDVLVRIQFWAQMPPHDSVGAFSFGRDAIAAQRL
jgi:hypothetical protein